MRTIDIMTQQLKRNFEDEDKVFDKLLDPEEPLIVENSVRSIGDSSDFMIPPNSMVIFNVQIENPMVLHENKDCDRFEAAIHFSSFQTPNFKIPVSFQVLEGSITLFPSDMVRFTPAIPGTTQSRKILAKSSLKESVYIKSVSSSNPRIVSAKIIKNKLYFKKKDEIIEISTVPQDQISSFLKMKNSAIFNYFMKNEMKGPSKLSLSMYNPTLTYFDILAWQMEQKEWDYRQSSRSTETTSIITIETNMIHNISIPVKTVITKPTLLNLVNYNFGKVEVDTGKRGEITIHNPSEHPIEVSFFIAPVNYLEIIIDELLSDEKLIKWKQL